MKTPSTLSGRFNPKIVLPVIGVLIWVGALVMGTLPAMRKVSSYSKGIDSDSRRVESLSSMSAAGGWFGAVADSLGPSVKKEYEQLFPLEKKREELFLEIASLAGASGIDPFTMREIPMIEDDDEYDEDDYGDGEEDMEMMVDHYAIDTSDLPSTSLLTYRLSLKFESDYEKTATFLASLERASRALRLHDLGIEQGIKGVNVTMEIDFYVQNKD